jgi:hypothetical protein
MCASPPCLLTSLAGPVWSQEACKACQERRKQWGGATTQAKFDAAAAEEMAANQAFADLDKFDASPETGSFMIGQTVVVHGLTSGMQYNGQRGQVVRPGEDGRWGVQLDDEYLASNPLLFKAENLRKVEKGAAPAQEAAREVSKERGCGEIERVEGREGIVE